MEEFYERRLGELEELMREGLAKVYDDQLIDIMKEDSVSMEFIHQRIAEIVRGIFNDEKEATIVALQHKNQ